MGNVYGSSGAIAPYIYGNTVNSAQNNLYLSDPDTQIQFTAHIDTDADAKIGVYFTGITSNGASVLLNYLQINSESRAKPYLDRVFCDNPEYGQLQIQKDDEYYEDEALTRRVSTITLDADKKVYAAWTRNRAFEDVKPSDWFYDDVMFVFGQGVMQGVSDTRFGPYLTATRAMMATILWRMEGSPAPTAETRFTDVSSGKWYSEAIAWTAQNGVYTGYADGSFRPNDPITREQLAAILYRYAKYKGLDVSTGEDTNILSYTDALEISDYAFPAMQWACGTGAMQGSNGRLLPRGQATRAQIAAMLHRYLVK